MAGYELRPVAIERSAGRGPLALTLAAGLVASMLVAKPWAGLGLGLGATPAQPPSAVPDGRAAAAAPPSVDGAADTSNALGSLARHSGTWGIGASGLDRADGRLPWARWTAVAPTAVPAGSIEPASPSSGLCDRVPTLPTDALFVAVSHETDVPIDRRVLAWWWNRGTDRKSVV